MTNSQLAELFLLRLYDHAEAEGHHSLLRLDDVAGEFGVTDQMKIYNVAKYLEGRGLIRGRYRAGGGVRAKITGGGAVFVESGGETGVIREYREHPENYRVSIDQSTHFYAPVSGNVAVHSANVDQSSALSPHMEALLSEMIAAIRADRSLSERRRREYLEDVTTLHTELQRLRPRRGIVETLVSHLGDLSSIASLAMQLQPYLPQILGSIGAA